MTEWTGTEIYNPYEEMTYSEYEKTVEGMIAQIEAGICQEKYHEWATFPDAAVRLTLAREGYELETLIHDPLQSVRMEVVRKDASYIKYALHDNLDTREWHTMYTQLVQTIDPDPETLMAFLRIPIPEGMKEYSEYVNKAFAAFRMQIEGTKSHLTMLEKTMSQKQLYLQKHPTWTRGLSAKGIRSVLQTEEDLRTFQLEHTLVDVFDQLIADGNGCTPSERVRIIEKLRKENDE